MAVLKIAVTHNRSGRADIERIEEWRTSWYGFNSLIELANKEG